MSPFRQAVPVWAGEQQPLINAAVGFFWDVPACRGVLTIACAGRFRLLVNGSFFAHGPERAAHGFARVEEWPIGDALVKPLNRVSIEVVAPGIASYYTIKEPAFLQAEITCGEDVVAHTAPDACEATALPHRLRKVHRYSFQRTFSEAYRVNHGSSVWHSGGAGPAPLAVRAVSGPKLLPRRAPLPVYPVYEASPADRFSFARREVLNRWKPRFIDGIGSVSEGFAEADLEAAPLRAWEECGHLQAEPAALTVLAAGQGATYQLPANRTGFIMLQLVVEQPAELILAFDEIRTEFRLDITRADAVNLIAWELAKGNYALESFEPYTLQFMQVFVLRGRLRIDRIALRGYEAPLPKPALASDPPLTAVVEAAWSTIRQNAADLLTDCPSRERAAWLWDSLYSARVANLLSGSTAFETAVLENYLLAPDKLGGLPSGMLPMCYPADHPDGVFIPQWTLWLVLQVQEYAQCRRGDQDVVDRFRPKIQRLFAWFKEYENREGLLEDLPGWQFIEWSSANELVQGVNFPTNWLYAASLAAAANLYGEVPLREKARGIQAETTRLAWNGKWFVDHAVRENDLLLVKPEATETCQYYAFYFGAANPQDHASLWETLLAEFGPLPAETPTLPLGRANFLPGFNMRFELLARYQLRQKLHAEAESFLAKMAERTSTLWEHNDTRASCCHAFAAHILVCLQAIDEMGLQPSA